MTEERLPPAELLAKAGDAARGRHDAKFCPPRSLCRNGETQTEPHAASAARSRPTSKRPRSKPALA